MIVIASDNDPTGEGDLLGWEIVDYLDWKKKFGEFVLKVMIQLTM